MWEGLGVSPRTPEGGLAGKGGASRTGEDGVRAAQAVGAVGMVGVVGVVGVVRVLGAMGGDENKRVSLFGDSLFLGKEKMFKFLLRELNIVNRIVFKLFRSFKLCEGSFYNDFFAFCADFGFKIIW